MQGSQQLSRFGVGVHILGFSPTGWHMPVIKDESVGENLSSIACNSPNVSGSVGEGSTNFFAHESTINISELPPFSARGRSGRNTIFAHRPVVGEVGESPLGLSHPAGSGSDGEVR